MERGPTPKGCDTPQPAGDEGGGEDDDEGNDGNSGDGGDKEDGEDDAAGGSCGEWITLRRILMVANDEARLRRVVHGHDCMCAGVRVSTRAPGLFVLCGVVRA